MVPRPVRPGATDLVNEGCDMRQKVGAGGANLPRNDVRYRQSRIISLPKTEKS
jgi:hypothetical protein